MVMLTKYITAWSSARPHTLNVLQDKFGPCALGAELRMLHLPPVTFRDLIIINYSPLVTHKRESESGQHWFR